MRPTSTAAILRWTRRSPITIRYSVFSPRILKSPQPLPPALQTLELLWSNVLASPNLHRAQQLAKKAKEAGSAGQRSGSRRRRARFAWAQRRLGALLEWQADYALAQRGRRRLSHVGVLKDWRAFQERRSAFARNKSSKG